MATLISHRPTLHPIPHPWKKPIETSISTRVRHIRRLARDLNGTAPATAHQLRHYFATSLLRAGTDSRVVQSLMRHESLATTGRYLAVNTDQQRTALSGLHPTPNATRRRVDASPSRQSE